MTPEARRFFTALSDAIALRLAGDDEGAGDLRTTAERDYLAHINQRVRDRKHPQMELTP